ncbi:MAG: dockerin type I domain-containing protein [Candidatus Zixiibacteriota bacterium]
MSFMKPKSVSGQASLLICLLVALSAFRPVVAGTGTNEDPAHHGLVEKSTLASIKIDTSSQLVAELVEIPILIRNDVEVGQFHLEVDFCYHHLTFVGAEPGEILEGGDWEKFTYRLLAYSDSLYKVQFFGIYDLPDGHQGVPLGPNSEYVTLVVLAFVIDNQGFPDGAFFPITFEWEVSDCLENTLQDPSFDTLYVSQDSAQFNTFDCPPESLEFSFISPSLEFSDGGITVFYPEEPVRGDINLNWIAYEVADWVLFHTFLLEGESVLTDPEQQAANSDVNCDVLPWSIADLLYMNRVILHDAVELVCKGQEESGQEYPADQFILVSSSANPGEVVSVPIWFANSLPSRGATFKLVFDENLLSVEGVETLGSRIPGWEDVYPVIHAGELFFLTHGDWWNENNLSFSSIEPGAGVLVGVNFRVDENAPVGEFVPITFETEELLGHYNSYTDTSGLVLIQPAAISGWIFTDAISGDANSDGIVDVADLVYLINYLYRGGLPPSPAGQGDFNEDGEVNLADLVALINYLFRS